MYATFRRRSKMKSKSLGAAAFLAALVAITLVPAAAGAHRYGGFHRVSIQAQPNPIVAGDSVVVFGRLHAPFDQSRLVVLYQHDAGSPFGFVPVRVTRTGASGAYEFALSGGAVNTNRSWYVDAGGASSRTAYERVASLVTINATGPGGVQEPDGSVLMTGRGHAYTFSGSVSPWVTGSEVRLQRQSASSGTDNWATIGHGRVAPGGTYSIVHTFAIPSETGGDANVRVLVRNDTRNIASPSTSLSYEIEQSQNPQLTIIPASYSITEGASDTISGVDAAGAGQLLTLYAHVSGQSFAPVATTISGVAGAYSFGVNPVFSTYYRVISSVDMGGATGPSGSSGASGSSAVAATGPHTYSATAFVGVRDVLTEQTSSTTVNQGQTITFSGTVTPDKTGRSIYLERENAAGTGWHIIATATIGASSTYSLTHAFYVVGNETVRIAISGSPQNQGAVTAPIMVSVVAVPAAQLSLSAS
jgi:hypothetical protein